ncbi:MAG: manganese catalase family protein [Clostridia bacterium]|nr:manganese catalase family protein [Clostridia bacterium]
MAHQEVLSAIIRQLTDGLSAEELEAGGFAPHYVEHTGGIYPTDANGVPYTVLTFQSKGDPITDLHEDLAAEQKARTTYENVLRLMDDPAVIAPLRFLREREIVHYQRFGESLNKVLDHLNSKNYYAFNPAFDRRNPHKS